MRLKHLLLSIPLLLSPVVADASVREIVIETTHSRWVLGVGEDRTLQSSAGTSFRPAYPVQGGTNLMIPALSVKYPDGRRNTCLTYVSHSRSQLSSGAQRTEIRLCDSLTALEVKLFYDAFREEDVIVSHAEIGYSGKGRITLFDFASSCLQLRADEYLLTHFHGSAIREMQVEHELLGHAVYAIENRRGTKVTHRNNPSFLLSLDTKEFSENAGRVIGGALCWSGNYRITFQRDEDGSLTVLSGINPFSSEVELRRGEVFETPAMVWTYSDHGAGGVSRNFHRWARRHAIYGNATPVPTLLNSWEGAYFKFDTGILKGMIDDAASLGLEMFVLDDGWFGSVYPRDNDMQGLGDWEPNPAKIPEGIGALASYAHEKGLKFGIWLEPEMVNPRSCLAEKHPDWIVGLPERGIPEYRHQWVLDLSNPAVQDFVEGVFDRTLALSSDIDYVKWDCNRVVWDYYSPWLGKDQNRFYTDYVRGLYKVLESLRSKYPDVMIQSCSSGGGRVDYGILRYCNEVWPSDNTDALERLRIQWGMSMIYPASIMASHVSVAPNHQTGRVLPLKFRFDVAASARLGMELQPKDLSSEEREFAVAAISSYKRYRHLVAEGDLYRIGSPDEGNHCGLLYVSPDRREAVLFAYSTGLSTRGSSHPFRLEGLDPSLSYRIEEIGGDGDVFEGIPDRSGIALSRDGLGLKLYKPLQSAILLFSVN